MAFFGVTSFGYQNTPKEHMRLPPIQPNRAGQPEFVTAQTDGWKNGPKGSYSEHYRLWYKHTRNPQIPEDIYRRSLTNAQEIGWWQSAVPLKQKLPWAVVERKGFPRSEMTK